MYHIMRAHSRNSFWKHQAQWLLRSTLHCRHLWTSANQAGPKLKTVCKRVWKNNLIDFKKICLGTFIMTKLETLDLKFSSSLVKKNLINSFLFVLKFLFSQPSKKNFIIHFGLASKKQSCKFLIWLPTEWYSKKIFCEEVSKNSIKKKLHAAMGKGTLLHSGLKW